MKESEHFKFKPAILQAGLSQIRQNEPMVDGTNKLGPAACEEESKTIQRRFFHYSFIFAIGTRLSVNTIQLLRWQIMYLIKKKKGPLRVNICVSWFSN